MTGQEKIAGLIVEKAQGLILSLAPKITELASELGIQNFGTANVKLPDTCPPKEKLDKIIFIRDNLYSKINSTARTIQNLSRPINVAEKIVTTTSATVAALNITKTASLTAITLVPPAIPVPGPIISGVITLDDLLDFLNPKITKAQAIISSISLALDLVNAIFAKLLQLLNTINQAIQKCNSQAAPPQVNDFVTNAQQQFEAANQVVDGFPSQTYKGFTLDIIEEQYSPTVKRIRAVAKNSSGVALLRTPLSFTSAPQTLIDQLKLIIDSNDNIKAY